MDAVTFQAEAMKHARLLWQVSWSILSHPEDCVDAIQEALLRAWQRRDTLRNMRSFRPWLVKILINTCHDMLRKRPKHKPVALDDETVAIEPFTDPVPLKEALTRLSAEHRTVIVLHYLEGYSVAEIAELLNAPSGTIKSRMMYARGHMREMLHDSIDE